MKNDIFTPVIQVAHNVMLFSQTGELFSFPSEGVTARLITKDVIVGEINVAGIGPLPIITQQVLDVKNLMPEKKGRVYVVSHRVARYLHDKGILRNDVFALAKAEYDEERHTIRGARAFMTFSHEV